MPHWRKVVESWLEFIIGTTPRVRSERKFAAVLFTDIVGSTEQARLYARTIPNPAPATGDFFGG